MWYIRHIYYINAKRCSFKLYGMLGYGMRLQFTETLKYMCHTDCTAYKIITCMFQIILFNLLFAHFAYKYKDWWNWKIKTNKKSFCWYIGIIFPSIVTYFITIIADIRFYDESCPTCEEGKKTLKIK